MCEDIYMSTFLLDKVNKVSLINEPLYYYRKRSDSIMGRAKQDNLCDLQLLDYRRERNAFFKQMNCAEFMKYSYADYFYWLIRLSKEYRKQGQKKVSDSLYLEFKKEYSEIKGRISFEGRRKIKYRLFYWFGI